VALYDQDSDECAATKAAFIARAPETWFEDIGEDAP
jgi:hypothetical protein